MFDATDAAARRSWVTSPYRSVEGNCFVARSEEHTSELQSLAYLVCRLIISEEHTSELQSLAYLVCRLLLEKKKKKEKTHMTATTDARQNKHADTCIWLYECYQDGYNAQLIY